MFKHSIAIGLAISLAIPTAISAAQGKKYELIEYSSPQLPPANYKGQWWTSPENCQYSRAGRPGETVWYLIVNTAHMKCPSRLIQRAFSDYN